MACFDGLYLKKSRPACSVLEKNIDILLGLMENSSARSDGSIALVIATFDVALPSEREKPS